MKQTALEHNKPIGLKHQNSNLVVYFLFKFVSLK
jgi:hypothetical protein